MLSDEQLADLDARYTPREIEVIHVGDPAELTKGAVGCKTAVVGGGAGKDEVDWDAVEASIDVFTAVVRRHLAGVTAPTDAEGYRKTTAAALLLRGIELLDAARTCRDPVQFPAAELVLRSGVDVALRGRYLLACPDADDELRRMHGAYVKRKKQLANSCGDGTSLPAVPATFTAALPPSSTRERDLFVLAAAIDGQAAAAEKDHVAAEPADDDVTLAAEAMAAALPEVDEGDAEVPDDLDRRSAMWAYRCLYQWMSNAAVHSGLHALERFIVLVDGKAGLTTTPEPLSSPERRHYLHVAAQLSELARAVFTAYGLPLAELEATGVRLPSPGPSPVPSPE